MNPRLRHAPLLCFAALAAVLRAAPEPAKPDLPGLPAAKSAAPADAKPAPTVTIAPTAVNPPKAAEKKSDAKSPAGSPTAATPDAKSNASASGTAPEKSAAAPAPANTKSAPDAPAKAPVGPTLTPRFLQVRARIDALFGLRNDPPPAPDVRLNPFRPPGAISVAPLAALDGGAEPVTVNNNLVLLQQAVATLKVRGVVQFPKSPDLGKNLQLVINSAAGKESTYKEGAIIVVSLVPDPVNLRVRVITRNGVTLTLGDAEMTLKF